MVHDYSVNIMDLDSSVNYSSNAKKNFNETPRKESFTSVT